MKYPKVRIWGSAHDDDDDVDDDNDEQHVTRRKNNTASIWHCHEPTLDDFTWKSTFLEASPAYIYWMYFLENWK